ncbi:FMN-binding glutamate synthase family protein [Natranaerobius trueperi]|uniref:FMN-binding glutamate synthase family protein n=1 Tax=Natranaerobius trueperi TaxID=759412 RepID=A0A226BYY8_9FIRM|nr:FMN-binding glutamate synthase family protein [Natranaerobius trueperi]OWZ83327.1 FMN-binding glutamate synthase family protein [Natranaerobius trueperi]
MKFNKLMNLKNWPTSAKILATSALSIFSAKYSARKAIDSTSSKALTRLTKDNYDENLWELVSATRRFGPQNIVETNLRAEEGIAIGRPLGSPIRVLDFKTLYFNIAQLHTLPTPGNFNIDTDVTIGPRAKRPLILNTPILISGMAYGMALSEKAKVAIAKATAKVGTATNTGEGAFLPKERKAAKYLILQFNRGKWNKSPEIIKQADMIEIQLGQGAIAGVEHATKSKDMSKTVEKRLGVRPGKKAVVKAQMEGIESMEDLKGLVEDLRSITDGVPIGVKMGASKYLEKDLEIAVNAGVDAVVLDGAEAATYQSPPILQDDFGVPTLLAIGRANQFFKKNGLNGKVSLIIGGGLYTPGDFLKAIALGADAVYIGTAAIFALGHKEVFKALPLEPPTQVIWETGHFKHKFNLNKGAANLEKYLKSSTKEMEEGIRALGKTSISNVCKDDLYTINPQIADITGVSLGYSKNKR